MSENDPFYPIVRGAVTETETIQPGGGEEELKWIYREDKIYYPRLKWVYIIDKPVWRKVYTVIHTQTGC